MSVAPPLRVAPNPVISAPPAASSAGRRPLVRLARGLAVLVLPLLLFVGATGWLYLLRHTGVLAAGPTVHDALPFQRLAGEGGQPLLRFVVAWLPAGIAGGVALRAMGVRHGALAAAWFSLATAALMIVGTGAADAITANESIGKHIAAQPGRLVPWLAAGLVFVPAAVIAWWRE